MKGIVALVLTMAGLASGFAQGQINFVNTSAAFGGPARLVTTIGMQAFGFTNGAPLVGTNYMAQLYLASDFSDVLVEGPSPFRITATTQPGTWNSGVRNFLPAYQQGSTVTLVVRVWDSNYGATYMQALLNGAPGLGQSAAFDYFIPIAPYAPNLLTMTNFQGFVVGIPEPSTISLGLLGIGALALFARRKA